MDPAMLISILALILLLLVLRGGKKSRARFFKPYREDFPTEQTIQDWDDASLYIILCQAAYDRYEEHGAQSLNGSEAAFCCLFELDCEFFHGGINQWLRQGQPDLIKQTTQALKMIGDEEFANVLESVLRVTGDGIFDAKRRDWVLDSLPEKIHTDFERLGFSTRRHETDYRCMAEKFARQSWSRIRHKILSTDDAYEQKILQDNTPQSQTA